MNIRIKGKNLIPTAVKEIQITGDWHSLFTKGRLVLHTNIFQGEAIFDDAIKIGTNVDVFLTEDMVVYLKILSFNFLQVTEGLSKTSGDLLELILISPWYMEDLIKTTARYGTSSQIVKQILDNEPNTENLEIESMADPARKRYQLGTTSFDFLDTLRPYLSTSKSIGLLFNGIYGKEFNLQTFSSLKEKESIFVLKAPGANIDSETLKVGLSDSKFYYNENKKLNDSYAIAENVTELQIEDSKVAELTLNPIKEELLSDLGSEYVHKVSFSPWNISPEEQRIINTRLDFLAEMEFNEAVLIVNGINTNFNLGNKITLKVNKPDKLRNSVLSNDYIIKGLTLSLDTEEEEEYTKMVVIPLIDLD